METKGIIGQGIFAVVTGVISFVGALFWAHRKQKQDRAVTVDVATAARDARISELENKLSLLTQSVMPISAAFQAILIKQLTHFHLPEIDALLAKSALRYHSRLRRNTSLPMLCNSVQRT